MKTITLFFFCLSIFCLDIQAKTPEWEENLSFQTSCAAPTGIVVDHVSATTAMFSWTASTGSVDPFYQYSIVTDNVPVQGPVTMSDFGSSYDPLLPNTTYNLFIRTLCDGVWSDWSTAVSFTTCNSTTVPYSLDFEPATTSYVPSCTNIENGGDGNDFEISDNPGNGFSSKTLQYTANDQDANAWFFTQGIEMEAGKGYTVTFKYGNDIAANTENFSVWLGSANNAAAMDISLIPDIAVTGAVDQTLTVGPQIISATGVYYVGFNAQSISSQGNLYIDDILVEEFTCGTTTTVEASNITATSAKISWTAPEGNPAIVYQYAVTTSATPPAEGEFGTSTEASVFELQSDTSYNVFVKAMCQSAIWGEWSAPITFTTCSVETLPYTEDFELATEPGFPLCTSTENISDGNDFIITANPGNGFDSKTLHYSASTENADVWFYTKAVQLEQGTLYEISFNYGNGNESTAETFNVSFGSSPNAAEMTNTILLDETFSNISVEEELIGPFSPPSTGIYYFGFRVSSPASQGDFYLDDIVIRNYSCMAPQTVEASNITTTGATVSWSIPEGNPANFYQYVVSTSSTPPATGTDTGDTSLTIADLEIATIYYVFVRSSCSNVWSEWSEPVSFTTLCDAPEVTGDSLQTFEQGATLADLVVNGDNITWYLSAEGGEALELTTPLEDGVTYYASQTIGCESNVRFAVTAEAVLSTSKEIFHHFVVSPNPAENYVNITNKAVLDKIQVYNVLGQKVLEQKVVGTSTRINVGNLVSGLYLLKATSGKQSKTIRLVKK